MSLNRTIDRVREFHDAFGISNPDAPTLPPLTDDEREELRVVADTLRSTARMCHQLAAQYGNTIFLRMQLNIEEHAEVAEALIEGDLSKVLHELSDCQVVLDGNYLEFGMADLKAEAFERIHAANMSKLGPGGEPLLNEAGRVLKGPNFCKADVTDLIEHGPTQPPCMVCGGRGRFNMGGTDLTERPCPRCQ